MQDTITVVGTVGTEPSKTRTSAGLDICSFRLCTTERRFDKAENKWVDASKNWYTVSTFRSLAQNVGVSVQKGDRVLVTGRMRVREWESGDKRGIDVSIVADALGHDLMWGTTSYARSSNGQARQPEAQEGPSEEPAADVDEAFPDTFADETVPF